MEIDGTIALVTGASSGIGAATARAVERNKREVIPTFRYWATAWLARVCPRIVDWLLVKTGWRHKM